MDHLIPATPPRSRLHAGWRILGLVTAAVVLTLIFASYLQPDFIFTLANRFILCL